MNKLFTKDIAVLDVTSRLVSAVIGTKRVQSVFGVKAVSDKIHSGFENGEWLDAEETVSAAESALEEVFDNCNCKVKQIFVGVPSEFIAFAGKDVCVTLDRERRVIDADIDFLLKKGDNFDKDKYVTINSTAVYFSVDTSDKLYTDVRGFSANRIEARVSYILCERRFIEMFDKIGAKFNVKDVRYIASCWAEGLALLEREQRDLAYALVDIGYISSSVTIGRGDGLLDIKSFSLGGGHIAADIYEMLDVSFELAEEAKGLVDLNLKYPDEAILVGDKQFDVYAADVCEIVRSRLDVFADIISDVLKAQSDAVPAYMPIYLTGEGVAEIRGARKYLAEALNKNVELLTPKLPMFNKPSLSSKIALLTVAETLAKPTAKEFFKFVTRGVN